MRHKLFPAFIRMGVFIFMYKIIMCTILEIILLINGDGVKEKRNIILKRSSPYDFKAMAAGKVKLCLYLS